MVNGNNFNMQCCRITIIIIIIFAIRIFASHDLYLFLFAFNCFFNIFICACHLHVIYVIFA